MPLLLIATQNKGKIREIQALLGELNLELVIPAQLKIKLDVLENGYTYRDNATKKAIAYAKETGLLTLADDSGLEVEILGGEPGIFSARYSDKLGATDADRRVYLLEKLKSHPQPWSAQFRCVVAIHNPGGKTYHAEGVCTGEIIQDERGDQGFGYDPIFKIDGLDYTMAELSMDMKNNVSHRARAIQSIKPVLIDLLKTYIVNEIK